MKISVIMPVYNSEKYLSDAIDSILEQDFEEFELLLVDDGSKDSSGEICDRYANKNEKVIVIHKKNEGSSSARNVALDIAKGEYIAFCDNDDIYFPHLLSDNYKLAKKNDADLVRYSRKKVISNANGKKRVIIPQFYNGLIERNEFGKYFRDIRALDAVWTGLYKKSVIDKYHLRFDENLRYGAEDIYFNLDFLVHCNRVYLHNREYYQWNQRYTHSTSGTFHREHLKTFRVGLEKDEQFVRKACDNGISKKDRALYGSGVVYLFLDYFNLAKRKIGYKEKFKWMDYLRNSTFFRYSMTGKDLKELFEYDKKSGLVWYLFYKKKYTLLFLIVGKGTKLLNKLRMK